MKKTFVILSLLALSIFFFITCSDDKNSPTEPTIGDIEIGTLTLSQDAILENLATEITFKIAVASGIDIVDSMLSLIKLDASNNSLGEIGKLYDNGVLANGDDIAGDNIFSGIIEFSESSEGLIMLQALGNAKTSAGQGSGYSQVAELSIFSDISSSENKEIFATQEDATDKFVEYLGGNVSNVESAVAQTVQWLQQQPQIAQVINDGNTSIQIQYKSGLYGGVIFSFKDANGTVLTQGEADLI